MKYKININPFEQIVFNRLHHQINGLQKLVNGNHYGGECLLLKFSKSEKWLYYAYFDANSGKTISEGNVAVSPENNLMWLYCFLKDDLNYKYLDTIFPLSVFGVAKAK